MNNKKENYSERSLKGGNPARPPADRSSGVIFSRINGIDLSIVEGGCALLPSPRQRLVSPFLFFNILPGKRREM